MRRWFLTLFGLVGIMLCVSHAFAQPPDFQASPHIYRLKIEGCQFDPNPRALTGFRIQGQTGIVTALHGVADCETASALSDNGTYFIDLTIRAVDIAHDVAIVWSDHEDQSDTVGLRQADINSIAQTQWRELHVVGYPLGLVEQKPTTKVAVIDKTSLAALVPDIYQTEPFKARNSPSLDISVFNVEAHLLPGHSGAPVLTPDDRVIGVANGGLENGGVEISWAIPWNEIKWRPIGDVQREVDALTHSDPQKALFFSNTYWKNESEEILLRPVTERTVNAFRSREQTVITPGAGGQPIKLIQEMSYNGLRGERSVEITSDRLNQLLGNPTEVINKLGAYWIGASNYYLQDPVIDRNGRLGSYCRRIGQPITDFDDLFQFRSQLMTAPVNTSTMLNGVYLNDERINGIPTRHYLVTIPPISRLGFPASVHSIVGDIWVAKQGNYIVRFVGEAPVVDASNPTTVAGTLHQVIDFYDVGKDIEVTLPAVCTKPTVTIQPTATAPATLPQTVPSATIHRVWPEYDVVQNGQQGMRIHVDFTVNGITGTESYVVAYFFNQSGEMLKGANSNYTTSNGQVAAYDTFTPSTTFTHYTDYVLFMPYDEMLTLPGEHDLQFVVNVIIPFRDAAVADESDFMPFHFSRQ